MEILYLILFSLPVLIAYLYLNRYIKKKGDTSLKSITFRIAIWLHGIALLLTIFSAILFYKEIIIRWGISWYIVYMTILSGITIYLTVSKKTAHYSKIGNSAFMIQVQETFIPSIIIISFIRTKDYS